MIHEKFKVITVNINSNGELETPSKKELTKFLNQPEVFAHSIGAQPISSVRLRVSIGYTLNKRSKPKKYKLTTKTLGYGLNDAQIEAALEKAASKFKSIICHELFTFGTDNDDEAVMFLHEVA